MTRPSRYYEIEDQIAAVIADLELYSYYQILDVEPSATADVILYTYNLKCYEHEQLQKDRFCGAVLHHNLTLLRERLDEAKQVLVDPTLRREYDRGLELGEMRHAATAALHPAAQHVEGPRDELIEHLVGKLERTINKAYIDAGEELLSDEPSMGIDLELVDQEKIKLEEQVAKLGVELQVKADEETPAVPLDSKFLDEATRQLTGKLYVEHNLSLHDRGEAEDVAADAGFAGELTEGLRGELYKMGVSEWEAQKEIERPIDVEFLDGLLAQEKRAVANLGVSAEVKADEVVRSVDAIDADELAAGLESELEQMKVSFAAQSPTQVAGLTSLVEESKRAETAPPPIVLIPLPPVAEAPPPFEDAIPIDDVLQAPPAAAGVQIPTSLAPSLRPPTGPMIPLSAVPPAEHSAPRPPTGPQPQQRRITTPLPQAPRSATGPLPQAPRSATGPLPQAPRSVTGPLPQAPARSATKPPSLPPLGIASLESAVAPLSASSSSSVEPDPTDDVVILIPDEEPSDPTKR
jgi:hypothetical protein